MTFDEMMTKIISNSPPSVMVKARFLGKTFPCGTTFPPSDFYSFVNITELDESYEVKEPREYKVFYSPDNTQVYEH